MAIVKVKKFNLITFKNELNALLKELQKFEEVDFRVYDYNLDEYKSENKEYIEDDLYKLESIIKKIRKYSKPKSTFKSLKEGKKEFTYSELENYVKSLNVLELVDEINRLLSEKELNNKKIENLNNEINEYSNWEKLDVIADDLYKLKTVDINLGTMSIKNFDKFIIEIDENSEVEIISKNKKEVNFILFSSKNSNALEILRLYNFNKFTSRLDKKVINIIEDKKNEIEKVKNEMLSLDEKISSYADKIEDLEISCEYYRNLILHEETKEMFKNTDKLSRVSGYIPQSREDEFVKRIEKICSDNYYLSYEEFDENDRDVPVKLKNNKVVEPYEMLIGTYSLPRYNEIDPTIMVAPFFWLFFGMMMADIGYGLVMAGISVFALIFFKLDKSTKNMIKFLMMLGISTIFWGLLYGSFFGYDFDTPLHIYSPTQNYQPIMILAITLGVIHVFIALLLKAYLLIRNKQYLDMIFDVLFWIVTLIAKGYYIYAKATGITDSSVNISKYTMYIFMLLIIATGGREAKSLGGKIGLGTYALYGISGYMGDFISYVRLMALGLSGGYIAYSVNTIASMIGNRGIMIIFMLLVLVIGHGFNLFLSVLGAYVHTSRLIYVEFFAKFYEGGGKAFNNFKIKEKYINIKNN